MKKIISFLLVVSSTFCNAQWSQLGPDCWKGNTVSLSVKNINGALFAIGCIGVNISIDNGANWSRISNLGLEILDVVEVSNKIIIATPRGIYTSLDYGNNWQSSNQGFASLDSSAYGAFFVKKLASGRLITSSVSASYFSDNNGQSWTACSQSLNNMVQTSSNLISCDGASIIKSSDSGVSWQTTVSNGILASDYAQLTDWYYINNTLYAGGNGILGLYSSTDNGLNWTLRNNGITGSPTSSLIFINNVFYKYGYPNGLFKFDTLNNQWSLSNISPIAFNSGRYFSQSNSYMGLAYSDNNGLTWQNSNDLNCMGVRKLSVSENMYVLGLYDGAYLYDTLQTSFTLNTPYSFNYSANTYRQGQVFDIKKRSNGTIYLATAGGVWKSTNNGASYTQSYNGLPLTGTVITVYQVNDLFVSGTFPNDTLFAATDNGIYFSTNDAQTFSLCTGTSGAKMQQFLKYNGTLYCAGTKIFKRSSPNNWTQFTTFANTGILGFAATDDYLFVAIANSPLKFAPLSGTVNFTNITTGSPDFAYSVAAYDTLVFFKGNGGVYKLNTSLLGTATQGDIVQIADNLPFYFAPNSLKLYRYMDSGFGMAIFNGKLWLGTNGMSTFYRSLADFGYDITVGEKAPSNEKIKSSGVVFPNPTQDKLTITDLAQDSQLTIYNSIGQLVAQLSNSQSQTIDISKLEKGIYTYSIITDNKQNEISSGKFIKE